MRAIAVIPARFASSRFPGKPLALLEGRPMIEHTWRGTRGAASLDEVCIATDDERIADACRGFGARVLMTSPDHATGTDRLAEAARSLDADVIVNVQGDEPLVDASAIDAAVGALRDDALASMSTVAHAIEPCDVGDRNRVKVWVDARGRAARFARGATPPPELRAARMLQHVGLYAYRRAFLLEFASWPASAGELSEQLEQLRALERGCAIAVREIEGWRSTPVDTPEDVARAEAALRARAARERAR